MTSPSLHFPLVVRHALRAASSLAVVLASLGVAGCARDPLVSADGLPLRRVVVYRNGVAYFERAGHVEEREVHFKMKESEVGDFLATLAVSEQGGSSVRSAAFPLADPADDEDEDPPDEEPMPAARRDGDGWQRDRSAPPRRPKPKTRDEKRGLKRVVLSLDGKAHDLEVGYIAQSPVWRPSYRLVVEKKGAAYLQAWGIVQNLSGEDWHDVKLSLVAGAPLAFEAQLGAAVVPPRPVVTDHGEVIAAVPRGETSLAQNAASLGAAAAPSEAVTMDAEEDRDGYGYEYDPSSDDKKDAPARSRRQAPRTEKPAKAAATPPPAPPPPPPSAPRLTAPRDLRSLAAVAVETGTTRYDLPQPVTIPDRSATMVMLLSRRVAGEALFLFAPDDGVPDSSSHPFRVARFTNATQGVLERGPIAVFESGSFLGQGMVETLPAGATATVPFALERALAVDSEVKGDERGARLAKIEGGELTIERDSVRVTTYRVRNGGDEEAKVLVRHARVAGARLEAPPPGTEDNVGTRTALVPGKVRPRGTADVVVDERTSSTRREDWFTLTADAAVKAYVAEPGANREAVAALTKAWGVRKGVVDRTDARIKLAMEQTTLSQQAQETRSNLRAIEKNKAAEQLRVQLTKRLAETSARLDEVQKQIVELDAKLAELRIEFREVLRGLTVIGLPAR